MGQMKMEEAVNRNQGLQHDRMGLLIENSDLFRAYLGRQRGSLG